MAKPRCIIFGAVAGSAITLYCVHISMIRNKRVSREGILQSAMFAQLRSDNIIVADTPPAQMHSTLINEYMALKRSGIF